MYTLNTCLHIHIAINPCLGKPFNTVLNNETGQISARKEYN
jgi:hypothetical protein